jgi:CDP-diacylglycerol--glycerol-3-phosphate 3-phosphatidyltransferase
MHPRSFYIINGLTFYRLIAAPFLLLFLLNGQTELFKWLLPISFLTDAIDGFLARKYHIASSFGAKLDSIADDLTVGVATIGIIITDPTFIRQHGEFILLLLGLFIVENILAYLRYRRFTSFHTYLAKAAAIFQGGFFILFFFTGPIDFLFYLAVAFTMADLVEEIILVLILPNWQTNVHGLPWVWNRSKKGKRNSSGAFSRN